MNNTSLVRLMMVVMLVFGMLNSVHLGSAMVLSVCYSDGGFGLGGKHANESDGYDS